MNYLFRCSGLYTELINALAADGENQVKMYTNITDAFPSHKLIAPGDNFEFIEKEKYFWDWVEWADVIGCFDVSDGDMMAWLKKKYPEKSIFSCMSGERLEDDRIGFKKKIEELGLSSIPYKVIRGMTALRAYLKENDNKVVKINIFRSDFESLKCKDYLSVKQILDDRQALMGDMFAESIDFLVEDMIDCTIEAGFDGFFSGGQFKHLTVGVEVDKNFYFGRVGGEIPDVLNETLQAFTPTLNEMGYAGAFSTEERIVSKNEHYFIDPCCRVPLPLGVLYSRFINNWPEVVYKIGLNQPYEISCDHKYLGAFAFTTDNAEKNYTLVQIKEGHRDDFRFLMAGCDKDGNYYATKGFKSVIVAVAGGSTPEEVISQLKANVEEIEAFELDTDSINSIDGIYEKIDLCHDVGIDL